MPPTLFAKIGSAKIKHFRRLSRVIFYKRGENYTYPRLQIQSYYEKQNSKYIVESLIIFK